MIGVLVAAVVISVPALAFALWPLRRGRPARPFLPVPPDAREPLLERKRAALRALRELAFEHDAGHVSDDDYAELRARYETEAATVLSELDRLGPGATERTVPEPSPAPRPGWRHPLAAGTAAVALVAFGVALGAGVVRHTQSDPTAGAPMPGSRPLASLEPAPGAAGAAGKPLAPEMLAGMLRAARASLFEGRYGEAIAAYQAVLKRDPKNVDAITHLGLIVAIGGHADSALEAFERALALDPNYPAALLYRGQVLVEAKHDTAGAIRSWEKFVAVVPAGEDRDRVARMLAEARTRAAGAPK
jgi:cytochrome c-type biogenesis protein CcmH/NrfG